jgi:ubiquitin carboxyl-terminal hydrolase 4/11/15
MPLTNIPDTSARVVTNPESMIGANAYLLFYRRRSERPLGNQELQELVDAYKNPSGGESDSSSSSSPTGEGQRLGGSSRNGSSSGLAGAAAAPQVGNGLRVENLGANDEYSSTDESAGSEDDEGMKLTSNGFQDGGHQFGTLQGPTWSFNNATSAHDLSQITHGNASADEAGLFDDDDEIDSNLAVGDDTMELDTRMNELNDSEPALTSPGEASFEDVTNLMDDDSSDDMPVVELRVGEDDKMASD